MTYERRDFGDFNLDAVNKVLREITSAAGSAVSVVASFSELPPDAADVRFLPGPSIEFIVPSQFSSVERRNFFTNRWLCTWPLFAAVKRRYPDLTGQCRLWLDDLPSGTGLTFCGNTVSHVLIPDSMFFESGAYSELRERASARWLPWEVRAGKIFWRGVSTGVGLARQKQRWQDVPRFRMCRLVKALQRADLFDVGLSRLVQEDWHPSELAEIEAAEIVRPEVPMLDFMNYRYSIDIDGNTCSWSGLMTKLIMGITTIKVESEHGYRQWYYDRLVPWKHFVPLSMSMDELGEVAEWLVTHPEEAFSIARCGSALAAELTMEKVLDDVVPRVAAAVTAGERPRAVRDTHDRHVTAAPRVRTRDTPTDADGTRASELARAAREGPAPYAWTDSPLVRCHLNRAISGDPAVGWLEYACRKYLIKDGIGVARGLSIGCGGGALERQARKIGACDSIDAIDLSQTVIDQARNAAAKEGVTGINYAVANLNELALDDGVYDVVFASCAVHQVANLENLFTHLAKCLKPGGVFVMMEYVGPSRLQFSDRAVQMINDLLAILPVKCRERSSLPGTYVTRFERNTIEHMNRVAPAQAIRSAEILPLLARTFVIVEKKDVGGTILQTLLQDIIHNFEDGSRERAGMLNLLLYLEMLLVKEHIIDSDFCLVVATPAMTQA